MKHVMVSAKQLFWILTRSYPITACSLKEHAIKPWSTPAYREAYREMMAFCRKKNIPVTIPFRELSSRHKRTIIEGNGDFFGVQGFFNWLETKTYKMHIRVMLSKYRAYAPCPACDGTRFKPDALLYRLAGRQLPMFTA